MIPVSGLVAFERSHAGLTMAGQLTWLTLTVTQLGHIRRCVWCSEAATCLALAESTKKRLATLDISSAQLWKTEQKFLASAE